MFEVLLWTTALLTVGATVLALEGSRDVFHPLLFIGPMMAFLYVWMPARLLAADGLTRFFSGEQLVFLQALFALGILAFVLACMAMGLQTPRRAAGGGWLGKRSQARQASRSSRSSWSSRVNRVNLLNQVSLPSRASQARITAPGAARRPFFARAARPAGRETGRASDMWTAHVCRRLLIGGAMAGAIGLGCWIITIVNVGGFVNAFSASYAGGWDDSGYVRDGSLLMLVGVLLSVTSLSLRGPRLPSLALMALFGLPWLTQALLTARRGPTFAIVVILLMGWYMARRQRPPVLAVALTGFLLGWSVLFLVTNRQSIHLGADLSDVKTDVGEIADKPDTGNEYIYGGGSVLSAQQRDHYFWMRRYLAQILVRPIPSAVWPTKYEDFGVPELLKNGGTGEGISDAMGWEGAVGSAPGIVADLWVEMHWLAIPAMGALGLLYGFAWKRAVTRGGPWAAQYVILSALSIYLVMQTMEAVIFRTLLLSAPCWLTWRWALRAPARLPRAAARPGHRPAWLSTARPDRDQGRDQGWGETPRETPRETPLDIAGEKQVDIAGEKQGAARFSVPVARRPRPALREVEHG